MAFSGFTVQFFSSRPLAYVSDYIEPHNKVFFFFFFSAFLAVSLAFAILGEMFAYVTVFDPTIEVVTFRLRGWCMLGVFFVAGTHPSRT